MSPAIAAIFGAALERADVGVALLDADDRLVHANPWFCAAFAVGGVGGGATWESMMRDCHRERRGLLIETSDIDAWVTRVRGSYRQQPTRRFESDLVDGRWLSVTETLLPDGWLLVVASDVTALKASEATLRHARDQALLASFTDPLTELYNRRFIMGRLGDLITVATDMRCALCVAALDLDHFKRINDRHGHSVGDCVLRHFAARLTDNLRPLDLAARVGGEEFLLLLPNTDAAGARQALARVTTQLAAPLEGGAPIAYTCSAGIAVAEPGDSVDRLLARADRALYHAKAAGRDRVVEWSALFEAPPEPPTGS